MGGRNTAAPGGTPGQGGAKGARGGMPPHPGMAPPQGMSPQAMMRPGSRPPMPSSRSLSPTGSGGLAPWLRQGSYNPIPFNPVQPSTPTSTTAPGGQPWYQPQMEQRRVEEDALTAQRAQAEALKQQEAQTAAAAAEAARVKAAAEEAALFESEPRRGPGQGSGDGD